MHAMVTRHLTRRSRTVWRDLRHVPSGLKIFERLTSLPHGGGQHIVLSLALRKVSTWIPNPS
jgi:hypothetical protein